MLSDDEEDDVQDDTFVDEEQDYLEKLRVVDELTSKMSKDEYIYFSECRQASFTYKKSRKFREWCKFNK